MFWVDLIQNVLLNSGPQNKCAQISELHSTNLHFKQGNSDVDDSWTMFGDN